MSPLRSLRVVALLVVAGAGCHSVPLVDALPPTRPPPKVGSSITHSQLCECRACDPESACAGPEDPPPAPVTCDSYDFSECGGITVASAEKYCARRTWRASLADGCGATAPAGCCAGTVTE